MKNKKGLLFLMAAGVFVAGCNNEPPVTQDLSNAYIEIQGDVTATQVLPDESGMISIYYNEDGVTISKINSDLTEEWATTTIDKESTAKSAQLNESIKYNRNLNNLSQITFLTNNNILISSSFTGFFFNSNKINQILLFSPSGELLTDISTAGIITESGDSFYLSNEKSITRYLSADGSKMQSIDRTDLSYLFGVNLVSGGDGYLYTLDSPAQYHEVIETINFVKVNPDLTVDSSFPLEGNLFEICKNTFMNTAIFSTSDFSLYVKTYNGVLPISKTGEAGEKIEFDPGIDSQIVYLNNLKDEVYYYIEYKSKRLKSVKYYNIITKKERFVDGDSLSFQNPMVYDQKNNSYQGFINGKLSCLNPEGDILWTFRPESKLIDSKIKPIGMLNTNQLIIVNKYKNSTDADVYRIWNIKVTE